MGEQKKHDLHHFMQQVRDEINDEYQRIHQNAASDPGTAGDQGEENWAKILREWLPSNYKIVTKGRIINEEGNLSPQIDVLVLKDIYPNKLLDKKHYLAAGVAAAFECKTTLKAEHIEKAVKTSAKVKQLYRKREGTPYKELHAPIIYGLLSHSHSWKSPNSEPEDNVKKHLCRSDELHISHPRECLDLLCVADLAIWTLEISLIDADWYMRNINNDDRWGGMSTIYMQRSTAISGLISCLTQRLAWENEALRDLAIYYSFTDISGGGRGYIRSWKNSRVFTKQVFEQIRRGRIPLTNTLKYWNEWQQLFHVL